MAITSITDRPHRMRQISKAALLAADVRAGDLDAAVDSIGQFRDNVRGQGVYYGPSAARCLCEPNLFRLRGRERNAYQQTLNICGYVPARQSPSCEPAKETVPKA
jgi:hypothetical protein